jgi:hypothetical protein
MAIAGNMEEIKYIKINIMALYSQKDMVFKDYSWTVFSNDNPKITGEPDNTLLNRKEGYEILYFINKFISIHEINDIETCHKIEIMIRKFIPTNIHSQKTIQIWIESHWYNY